MIAVDNKILQLLQRHRSGKPVGITSICSANYYVIKAAVQNAKQKNLTLLIEATSNQVDQFGGYTGETPEQFKYSVLELAASLDFPEEEIILGGDHLGPNRWQNEISVSALQKACDLVSAYVSAGFTKIHLDASMKCIDDGDANISLYPSVIAERCAILCKAAEEAVFSSKNNTGLPFYIIGTDVPPPGGAKENHAGIHVTSAADVEETISLTKAAFKKYNLQEAWDVSSELLFNRELSLGMIWSMIMTGINPNIWSNFWRITPVLSMRLTLQTIKKKNCCGRWLQTIFYF